MHEYSIVEALLERVEEEVAAQGGGVVKKLHVTLGENSGVDPTLLATAFRTFGERSSCQNAELFLRESPARWRCTRCGVDIAPGGVLRCKTCQKPAELISGDEILLERIELEVAHV